MIADRISIKNSDSSFNSQTTVQISEFFHINKYNDKVIGDRGWTLQNLHFTPYLSNEKTFTLHLGSAVSPLCVL